MGRALSGLLIEITASFIPFLKFSLIETRFQWLGSFAPDYGAKLGALIFNKTVGLKEN